jgi:hypothetical protein
MSNSPSSDAFSAHPNKIGKGMVRNYGAPNVTSPDPMPFYYNNTLGADSSLPWNWSRFVPHGTSHSLANRLNTLHT